MFKRFLIAAVVFVLVSAQASAMQLTTGESLGSIGLGSEFFTLSIDGGEQIDGDESKGVVLFGENLYFHFDATLLENQMPQAKTFAEEQKIFDDASRFGGDDVTNCVPVFVFEGRTIVYPITSDDGREFYLLATETGGGGSMKVIGERDGVWVKYFDTQDMRKLMEPEFYIKEFHAAGDALVFVYEQFNTNKTCELYYQWDASVDWFGVELRQ